MRNRFRVWRLNRAARLLRKSGYLVTSAQNRDIAVLALRSEVRKLTRMGGGNLSKLRNPRKSIRRVGERMAKLLEELETNNA